MTRPSGTPPPVAPPPAPLPPTVIYDDGCAPCTRFARVVKRLAGGGYGDADSKLAIVGHYSARGAALRAGVLGSTPDATDMFWFVCTDTAYGGRTALLPLFQEIVRCRLGIKRRPGGTRCQDGVAAGARQRHAPPTMPPAAATAAAAAATANDCRGTAGSCGRGGGVATTLGRLTCMLLHGKKIRIGLP